MKNLEAESSWTKAHFPEKSLSERVIDLVVLYVVLPLTARNLGLDNVHLSEPMKIDKNTDWKAMQKSMGTDDTRGEGSYF